MRILIVDDDYVSRLKLKALLSGYGTSEEAEDGEQALAMIKQAHEEKNPYKVITMDFQMPGKEGVEVTAMVRSCERLLNVVADQKVKILMITSSSDPKVLMASMEEGGAEWFLKKPVNPDNLRIALAKLGISLKA